MQTFTTQDGALSLTYTSEGLFVDTRATRTEVVAILPAAGDNSKIGDRPVVTEPITLTGLGWRRSRRRQPSRRAAASR